MTVGFNVDGLQPNASNPIGNPAFPGKTVCRPHLIQRIFLFDSLAREKWNSFKKAGAGSVDEYPNKAQIKRSIFLASVSTR
jgi:hypothetical protein